VFYRDTLEIKISNASQIVNFVPAPSASATAPSSKFAQTVRGRVKLARWSASRKTLYLELEGGSELPVITIFQNEAAVIAAAMANGGELDEFFRGRSIEVRGNLEDYPVGWNTKYVGRKQIIVLEVSQIRVMSDQPATAASK